MLPVLVRFQPGALGLLPPLPHLLNSLDHCYVHVRRRPPRPRHRLHYPSWAHSDHLIRNVGDSLRQHHLVWVRPFFCDVLVCPVKVKLREMLKLCVKCTVGMKTVAIFEYFTFLGVDGEQQMYNKIVTGNPKATTYTAQSHGLAFV